MGPRKILFHSNQVVVDEYEIPADFVQFISARRIFLWASLDEPHRNNIFKFITGTGNALVKFRIFTIGSKHGEFCEFLVKVYTLEIHFYNFKIKLDDLVPHEHGNRA
jgi:hypothetical protein